MATISFYVPGEPKALKRHRQGKFCNYDPSSGDKADFLAKAMQVRPDKPLSGPLSVDIEFLFNRPKSHFGTGKNSATLKPSAPYWHTSRPDCDNLQKFVMDALNGVFWHDDAMVCKVKALKSYASGDIGPGVFVEVNELYNKDDEFFTFKNGNPV